MRTEVGNIGSISRLVFGCASVGGRASERASLRAMASAFERGITTFDVARSYGYGEAEAILGKFLEGRRGGAQIVTKAGIVAPRPSRLFGAAKAVARRVFAVLPRARVLARPALGRQHVGGHFEPRELEASLVASLRALRTDYVDTLFLHACSPEVATRDDVRAVMGSFVRRGLARRVGVAAGVNEASLWIQSGGEPTAQFPAAEVSAFAHSGATDGMWLANQPLGGGRLLAQLTGVCATRKIDPRLALEFLLRRPLRQGAHGVVLSMLSEGHVQLAADAVHNSVLQTSESDELEKALKVSE